MAAPIQHFYFFVFNVLFFNGIALSMTFRMARHLYCKCKHIVYGSYGRPVGNHVITCEPKLPQYLQVRWSSGAKVQDSSKIKDKRKYLRTQQKLLAHYANQTKKSYETSHSRLPLKIKHCSIFGKIIKKKTYLRRIS